MKIIMKQGVTDEQIETIEAHLRAFGSHFSVSRDPSGVMIHTDNNSWGLCISIGKMPGIAKIERGLTTPRFIEGKDVELLKEFLRLLRIEGNVFRLFGSDMFEACSDYQGGKAHPPHDCPEEKICLGKSGLTGNNILIIAVEERPRASGSGSAKGIFFYVPRNVLQPPFAQEVLQGTISA